MGFMLIEEAGQRVYQIEDYRTIAPRILSDAEFTQALLPPEIEAIWYQENWRAGMGLVNHRLGNGQYGIAEGYKVDTTSPSGIIKLARAVQTTAVSGAPPAQYLPTGFAAVGSEVWAFIGDNTFSWNYANANWVLGTFFVTVTDAILRNGVEIEGYTYVPRWFTGDTPHHYIYKADADADWTNSTLLPSGKYMAKADNKLWMGNIRDEADSTLDAVTTLAYDASSSGTAASGTTITVSHTCTGANRALLVGVSASSTVADNRRIPLGVTFGGLDMTKVREQISGNLGVSIWALSTPSSGANNIVATFTAAFDDCVLGGVSFTGAHQTTASLTGTANSATGSSTAPSVAISTGPKGIVFGVVGILVSTSFSAGTGETERWDMAASTTTGAGFTEATGAGDTSITIAPTALLSGVWAIAGVEVVGINILSGDTTILTGTVGTTVAVNDEIVIRSTATPSYGEELMQVTTVNASSIVVTRGYKGTGAGAHNAPANIYKATYNVHHVRPASDATNTGSWAAATAIGTADAPITGLVPYVNASDVEFALVCKTDGLWTLTAAGATAQLYSMTAQQHPNNFQGAYAWDGNERVLLPLGAGGMFELRAGVIRDISFSLTMPDQTHLHGRVAVVTSDATHVFVLVQETANTRYHLMMGELVTIGDTVDYRWHHVGRNAYTTGTNVTQNALMACGVPSGATVHHRVWLGLSSTGSNLLPYFYTLDNDVSDRYTGDDDAYAVTVKDDRGHPLASKRYSKIDFTTSGLGSTGTSHYIEVKYRVDGGAWTYVTGAQASSKLTQNAQTLTFAAGVTGQILELQFLLFQGTTTTTTPQVLDFRVVAQLRLATVDVLPVQVYLAEGQTILNRGREPLGVEARLTQLESWQDQAAEVTVIDARGTSRSMVFLRGTFRCREVAHRLGREPEYVVGFVLAAA